MHSNGDQSEVPEDALTDEVSAVADTIYGAYLPPYLKKSWQTGRGSWYEEIIREQLDSLVISETCDDPERLGELKRLQNTVSLILGIFGASFRILDHIGMHLRGQTMGQYELLPEDEVLLRKLCQQFLKTRQLCLNPFYSLSE
jgi:hypothetical protein